MVALDEQESQRLTASGFGTLPMQLSHCSLHVLMFI